MKTIRQNLPDGRIAVMEYSPLISEKQAIKGFRLQVKRLLVKGD